MDFVPDEQRHSVDAETLRSAQRRASPEDVRQHGTPLQRRLTELQSAMASR